MGKAFKCDICNKLFDGEVRNKISIDSPSSPKQISFTRKTYELCNKCFGKVARVFGIDVYIDEKNIPTQRYVKVNDGSR